MWSVFLTLMHPAGSTKVSEWVCLVVALHVPPIEDTHCPYVHNGWFPLVTYFHATWEVDLLGEGLPPPSKTLSDYPQQKQVLEEITEK